MIRVGVSGLRERSDEGLYIGLAAGLEVVSAVGVLGHQDLFIDVLLSLLLEALVSNLGPTFVDLLENLKKKTTQVGPPFFKLTPCRD